MKENSDIRTEARETLSGHWSQPILATLIYIILISVISAISSIEIIGWIIAILIGYPLMYAYMQNFITFTRDNDNTNLIGGLFDGFKTFGRSLGITLLMYIFIALWTCLLIIPGIIMGLAYSMTFFIAKDHPEMGAYDCIVYSRKMMKGHKLQLFILFLSFIGWLLLSVLTFGIGFLWLNPYVMVSSAKFYEEIKSEYEGEASNNHPQNIVHERQTVAQEPSVSERFNLKKD